MLRCNPTDVEQLQHIIKVSLASSSVNKFRDASTPKLSYTLSTNIGASELYALGASRPSFTNQTLIESQLYVQGLGPSVAFARQWWPLYTPNYPTFGKFAKTSTPILLLSRTLDPNTSHAMAHWVWKGLGGNAQLVRVPYAAHGTVNPTAPCVAQIALKFLMSYGLASIDRSCLSQIAPPDFDGTLAATQAISQGTILLCEQVVCFVLLTC
jgi:pimeloyl-ACP methyl ester carboxylesterase